MAIKFSDTGDDDIVAEINITPLTDIFLVLLIIFMISSSAMMEGGLQVKLPTAKSTAISSSQSGKPIFITVAKSGEILVNEKPATGNLADTIRETLAQTTEKTVVIRGDEAVFLGKAVEIMDAARSAGAEKIALATQPPSKSN
jgi:biopolymer transport protein ExbD